ncbi:MAG: DUF2585 family protein [Desulfobulbia bacterium]
MTIIFRNQFLLLNAASILFIIIATAIALLTMGRVPWCECGYIKPWHGEVMSSENSQHFADWYSFTHIVHGFVFYALLWQVAKNWPIGLRAVAATLIEALWEIVENTDFIINRYREITISLDYFGDSVVNSLSDIFFMLVVFFAAALFPIWLSILAVIGLEFFLGYVIRDNVSLNIIMLIHPFEPIKNWQMGF